MELGGIYGDMINIVKMCWQKYTLLDTLNYCFHWKLIMLIHLISEKCCE